MNTHVTRRILWTLFAVTMFATAHGAHASLFRTYLSVNGNDANPCTVPAPCRLLPAALAAVNDGGEVWMLDSGNFNTGTVSITKSVTILAIPGAVGSIVANGGDAIWISTAGVKVTLRNLNVLNLSGTTNSGVYMGQGAALTVEDCEIYGTSFGLNLAATNGVIAIKNTVIRDTRWGVMITGTGKATLDAVQLLNSASTGLYIVNGPSAAVRNTVFAGNVIGIYVSSGGGTTSRLLLVNSVINAGLDGIMGITESATDAVSITLDRNVIAGNTTGVKATSVAANSTLTVVLDDNALITNTTAINYLAPAAVFSRGNNTLKLNGADVSGPALTPLAGQ